MCKFYIQGYKQAIRVNIISENNIRVPMVPQKPILEKAHAMVPEFRKSLKERRHIIIQERDQVLKKKQEALVNARQKKRKILQKISLNMDSGRQEKALCSILIVCNNRREVEGLKAQLDLERKC